MIPGSFSELVRADKLEVSLEQILTVQNFLEKTKKLAEEAVQESKKAELRLAPAMSAAVDSVRVNLSRALKPGADAVRESCELAAGGVRDYLEQSRKNTRRNYQLCQAGEENLRSLRAAAERIAFLARLAGVQGNFHWQSGPPAALHLVQRLGGACPVPAGSVAELVLAEMWARAAQEWRRSAREVLASVADVRALAGRHRQAEAALVALLSFTPLGSLRGVMAAGGAALAVGAGLVGGRKGDVLEAGSRVAFGVAFAGAYGGVADAGAGLLRRFTEMLRGGVRPSEVSALWEELGASGVDRRRLLRDYAWELAGVDGLPLGVRRAAAEGALLSALGSAVGLAAAHGRSGQLNAGQPIGEFRKDLVAVARAAGLLPGLERRGRQLLSLGTHDGVVTAAVCDGDIARAKQVVVFVQGMKSQVRDVGVPFAGLRRAAELGGVSGSTAIVSWVGYRSPNEVEETRQFRANAGGLRFASFLDGVVPLRGGVEPERLVVMGHSYGSNVAAVGVSRADAVVDTFVTLGSAGLPHWFKREDLGVREVFATHADADLIAVNLGQRLAFVGEGEEDAASVGVVASADANPMSGVRPQWRVDPRDLEGVRVFSSGKRAGFRAVTGHGLLGAKLDLNFNGRQDFVGYLDPFSSTVWGLGRILAGR